MESIILDNGIEYLIIDTEVIDGDECYVGLDDDNEIDKVLLHFTKKNIK